MENKKTLYADTVLRKDGDQLCLMNKQEGGFRAWAIPIQSEQWLMDNYHVRVGEWSRDEHGAFCPVTRIPRSEQPTLHDGVEEVKLHDFGARGSMDHSTLVHDGVTEEAAMKALMGGHVRTPVVDDGFGAMDEFGFGTRLLDGLNQVAFGVGGSLLNGHRDPQALAVKLSALSPELRAEIDRMMSERGLELVPYMINGKVIRSDSLEEIRARAIGGLTRAQALGQALYDDGALSEDKCFQGEGISPGLQQFIDAHPGVRVGMGPGPFLVALMPDGSAMAVDTDGTVIAEDDPALDDGEPSKSAFKTFVEDTDWDAINDALGPDD